MNDVNGHQAAQDDRDGPVFELDATSVVRVPVNNGPISDIDISPDGRRLIATHYGRNMVSVIDTKTSGVCSVVGGLNEPFAVTMSGADANYAYVSTASPAYDSIEVVDVVTNWRIASYQLAHSISDLTVSPDGRRLYASRNDARGADVAVVDTTTGELESIELASTPGTTTECLRISADGRRLYVGVNGPSGGSLVVIETRARADGARTGGWGSIVGTLELGLPLRDVALSDDGRTAYVASCGPIVGAVLDIVDTRANKIVSTHKINEIQGPLTRMTLSRDGERAYLVSDDGVTVLCTRTQDVIGEIKAATQPSCVVESPDGSRLYIADYSGVVVGARIASIAGPALAGGAAQWDWSPAAWLPELAQSVPVLA